jgi:hypothetical protein
MHPRCLHRDVSVRGELDPQRQEQLARLLQLAALTQLDCAIHPFPASIGHPMIVPQPVELT